LGAIGRARVSADGIVISRPAWLQAEAQF